MPQFKPARDADATKEGQSSEHGGRANSQKDISATDASAHQPVAHRTTNEHHQTTPESLQPRPTARARDDAAGTRARALKLGPPPGPPFSKRRPPARVDVTVSPTPAPAPTHPRSRRTTSTERPPQANDRSQDDAAAHDAPSAGPSARARARRRSASPVPVREARGGDTVERLYQELGIPAEKADALRALGLTDERVRNGRRLGKLREDYQKEFGLVMVEKGFSVLDAFMVLSSGAEARPSAE
ncbi:uncharacterized protein BXZ73DRAFT_82001 [Epithele typhae]|uniref:uncharacterized protein n=1 Tax=Epithele typhae TaxID=378194 RepID=UPI0020088B59|nr:uncharacterized protein BXZ73DRAFT_82001 [Epithele typhae]KAH9913153.1 hypothetical protein BXZ73DRAFT_82001 [Epithele typhae]